MSETKKFQARQGDLLFVGIGNKGDFSEIVKDGVLARGEVTGHAHRIAWEDLKSGKAKVGFMDEPRKMVIEAFQPVTVVHEEHKSVRLPKGRFEVISQREYTPREIRRVAD